MPKTAVVGTTSERTALPARCSAGLETQDGSYHHDAYTPKGRTVSQLRQTLHPLPACCRKVNRVPEVIQQLLIRATAHEEVIVDQIQIEPTLEQQHISTPEPSEQTGSQLFKAVLT